MPPVPAQVKRRFAFFPPVVPTAPIHSDGVREQVFAPGFSIKSRALEEEMKNNVPIFGDAQGGKMAHSLSLRELWVFSNRGYYSSEGQHLHLPRALHLAGTFFDYRAFVCHIKSICQAFYNGYLLFFTATLRPTSTLPFNLQEAAAPSTQSQPFQGSSGNLWLGHCLILIKVQLQKLLWSESRTGNLAALCAWRITMIADLGKKKIL